MANVVAKVTSLSQWEKADVPLLTQHYQNLKDRYPERAVVVKAAIDAIR
jgi:hypothetical protein